MSAEARSFYVRLAIDTPLALRGLLHLDGLLMSLAASAGQDPAGIPLSRHGGVAQGSAAILECGIHGLAERSVPRTKRISDLEIPPGVIGHLTPGSRRLGTMSAHRPQLASYPLFENVRAVVFAGRGSLDAAARLLSEATSLGAMGRAGYGNIADMDADYLPDDRLTGFRLPCGMPARVIELRAWEASRPSPLARPAIGQGRAHPPYWAGTETDCVIPLQCDLSGTRREVAGIIGLEPA